jgi:hypothetical protein
MTAVFNGKRARLSYELVEVRDLLFSEDEQRS